MNLSVKTIFIVLIGTLVAIVVFSAAIEMVNVTISSFQMTQTAKLAARQAAILFSQETYKQSSDGGSINVDAVKDESGAVYVSGDFYPNMSPEQIYEKLYGPSASDFRNWLGSSAVSSGKWKSIDLIADSFTASPVTLPKDTTAPGYEAQAEKYSDYMLGKSYHDVMMTPLNMGVPYLDPTTLEKMFKWNLAMLLSNCGTTSGNMATIRAEDIDENGNPTGDICIHYNGFRIYADRARITNLEYKVFNLEDSVDKDAFERATNIKADNLGFDDSLINYLGGYENDDERKRVCVVGIEYSVPVSYEGVTPIRQIFKWMLTDNSSLAEGYNGFGASSGETLTWNDAPADLTSGGFDGNNAASSELPVPGKLIYYVVR